MREYENHDELLVTQFVPGGFPLRELLDYFQEISS